MRNATPLHFAEAVAQLSLAVTLIAASMAAQALVPLENIAAIAAGYQHTCALTTGGGVKCWGSNRYGQLGDNSTTDRPTPVDVFGLMSGVAAIAVGNDHTCALTKGGGVKCWGDIVNSRTPVDVVGLANGVTAITAGYWHTCALTTSGGVKCWGNNRYGQLGDRSPTETRATPVDVVGFTSGVAAIAAGYFHTCALTTAGGVKCWGLCGGVQPTRTPVDVVGLTSGVAAIAAGEYDVCGVTTGGGVKCSDGQADLRAVDVLGLTSGVTAIAIGDHHTCVLTAAGGVKCWGSNNYGQVGDPTTFSSLTPVDVFGLTSGAAAIATGFDHSCAVTTGGRVKCWGDNKAGQLGDNSNTQPRLTSVDAFGLTSGIAAIAAGGGDTCALTIGGGVKCWGDNQYGQLGDGFKIDGLIPVDVVGLAGGVAAIATGGGHTCALTTGGGVKCWGENLFGELGLDPGNVWANSPGVAESRVPVDVPGLTSGVASIAAGGGHTCALTTGGGVKCWGYQRGGNQSSFSFTPANVSGVTSGVAAIEAGVYHTCALTTRGGVKCWGDNSAGQLGNNSTTSSLASVDVSGISSGVAAIATGGSHTCALTTGGGVKCWGDNSAGQLGDNSTANRSTPVEVTGLASGVAAIKAGGSHTCALTPGGGVKCWGNNSAGQLGDNSTTNRLTPVDVLGLTSGVAAIATGGGHTCALTTSGAVKCWGASEVGQLGDGSGPWRIFPVDVVMPANTPGALSGLWWNANEPGWGIHFTQRGSNVLAAWYTYDSSGNPKWYVSTCAMASGAVGTTGTCNGTLYEVNGPTFFGTPFNPSLVNAVPVGNLQVAFQDANTASMTYTGVAGQTRTVAITRLPLAAGPTPGTNYTDLWWNPTESGWGMAITQEASTIFIAWYVYDGTGRPIWYVATCTLSGTTCSSDLLRTTGPVFGPTFDPSQVHSFIAGTVSVNFTDGNNATLNYTVNGVSASKAITRQLF